MQVLWFFVFVVAVAVATSAFGYGLSFLTEQTLSRRCRMLPEGYHRRRVHRQRGRCRLES